MKANLTNREKMYLAYKRELCKLDGVNGLKAPEEWYIRDADILQNEPDAEWIPVKYENKEVGFLIIVKGKHLKRGEDYRIEETYVKPKYRRRGLMSKEIKLYLAKHPGKYSMQVMVNNPKALAFWAPIICNKIYGKLGLHNNEDGKIETIDILFDTEKI